MKKKPPYKRVPREKIQKKVNFIRKLMSFAAKDMVAMEGRIGKSTWFQTEKGPVQCLCYGFENPEVTPVLFDIHGGGFVMASAGMDDPYMPQFVEKCGVKVIGIDYTLAPDEMFPYAIEQCRAVMLYVKEHAKDLKVDPDRMMIMGHSAGGNFCAAIGLMENSDPKLNLKGIILDYPPTDIATDPYDKPMPEGCLDPGMSRMFNDAYCKPEEAKNPLVSPTFATVDMVDKFPPTLVITASHDSLADETEHLKDTLISAGVDVTFKRFEGCHHGFTVIDKRQAKKNPKDWEAAPIAWDMMVEHVKKYI